MSQVMSKVMMAMDCPCGNQQPAAKGKTAKPIRYLDCCGLYHAGQAAPTAQALMRSRYSAFVLNLQDYIQATWHTSTRPNTAASSTHDAPAIQWLRLKVHAAGVDPVAPQDQHRAIVEFSATYRESGKAHHLHETSRFVFEQERWWYVEGDARWE